MTRTGGGPESAVWATAATGAAVSRPSRGRIVARMVLSFASKTVTAPETRTLAVRCQPSSGQTFWDLLQPTPRSVPGQRVRARLPRCGGGIERRAAGDRGVDSGRPALR